MKLTENLVPGTKFEDQYLIQNLTNNYYHGDGQVKDEDYVYGSFLQSKMYANGVKCNDCHNVHTLKLKFEGNKLCLQCHVPAKYEAENHYFHEFNTASSLCINCHKDKTNQWAANIIEEKFGNKRAPHFSDNLLLSAQLHLTNTQRSQLDDFINDLNYPKIARATSIGNLDFTTTEQYKTLLTALKDSSAIVRYNALLKFRILTPQDRLPIALEHMKDSAKIVRIAAVQLMVGLDENTLSGVAKSNFITTRNELETMLFSNADFSIGRLQLGDYYLQKNDVNNAIKHYEIALKKDSLLLPVFSNLATAYSLNKDFDNANKTLDNWILLDLEISRPHFIKGLLNFEQKNDIVAISELKIAIQINPNDTRSLYNLATYYFQNKKDLNLSENYIKNALKVAPENQDYNYLLALVYQAQGKMNQAKTIMKRFKADL